MAADRGAFIDQSQSFNVFVQDPNYGKLSSMHFYGWKKGLKTGMYYLRTRAAADAIKFTVDQQKLAAKSNKDSSSAKATTDKENDSASNAPTAPPPEPQECLACGA